MVDRARSKDKRIENARDPRKIVPHEIEMKVSHAVETNCTFLSALFLFRRFLSKLHTRTVAFIFCFSYIPLVLAVDVSKAEKHTDDSYIDHLKGSS